jgi:hypothetical protein
MPTTPLRRASFLAALALAALVPSILPRPGFAEDEDAEPAATVDARVYEVYHGDLFHPTGRYVREIHIPSLDLSFCVVNGELKVFRPSATRYLATGEVVTLPLPDKSRVKVPVLHLPGTAPVYVRTTQIPAKTAERFARLLEAEERLRNVADRLLSQ